MFGAMCLHENSDVEKLLMLSTIKSFYLSKTFRMSFFLYSFQPTMQIYASYSMMKIVEHIPKGKNCKVRCC